MRGLLLGCVLWSVVGLPIAAEAGTPASALTDRETVERPTRQTSPAQEDPWTKQLREDRERQSKRNAWVFVAMALTPFLILAGYVCFAVWERRTGRLPFADKVKSPEDKPRMSRRQIRALLKEMRALAREEPDVAAVLKRFNLL